LSDPHIVLFGILGSFGQIVPICLIWFSWTDRHRLSGWFGQPATEPLIAFGWLGSSGQSGK
jgi:hypothetical protein